MKKSQRNFFYRGIRFFLLAALLLSVLCVLFGRWETVRMYFTQINRFDIDVFLQDPPSYNGHATTEINKNIPLFTRDEITQTRNVSYSPLDDLGRCGTAFGLLGPETIPQEKRGMIGDVRPSGWHTVRYDDRIEDRYLYNRCHLIGYQLAGDNADPCNLITGTRYLNMSGMLPYENKVFAYISETGNHVLYRVRPVFLDDNLLASGVLMEATSVEDHGRGVSFFVYAYNVQPGVIIDYKTGDSLEDDQWNRFMQEENDGGTAPTLFLLPDMETGEAISDRFIVGNENDNENDAEITYILNTNTKRFHDPSCPSVQETKEKNKQNFYGTREEVIAKGYVPCGRCKP